MTAEDLVDLYSGLVARGVRLSVDGGWGIDALLGRQTRPHKDFDAIAAFEDLPAITRFLGRRGFALKVIWPENRWAPSPELPVLIGREVGRQSPAVRAARRSCSRTVRAARWTSTSCVSTSTVDWCPAGRPTSSSPPGAFDGQGNIGGTRVRCLSAEMQMRTHG